MAHLIGRTTGEPTARFGFRGTDLGYFTKTNHGYCLATFGDTFDNALPGGSGWRSPVILRTHNADLSKGVVWDNAVGGARAKQVIDYVHQTEADARAVEREGFTQIPNDVIHLPDGRYLMSAFKVRDWSPRPPGNSWVTWANRFWTSTETHAEVWTSAQWADLNNWPMKFDNNPAQGWDKFQNATLVLSDGYLYMFGTQSGRYAGGGIYLSRVKWQDWNKLYAWQFWTYTGGQWQWAAWQKTKPSAILTPALPGGAIGEINARWIEGTLVLSYVDYSLAGGSLVTRTATGPAAVWSAPQVHATQATIPNLYAPAVHPYSTLDAPYAHVSQWNDTVYGSSLYRLDALREAAPTPGAPSLEGTNIKPECVDLSALSADQLAQVLTSDTSVSTTDLLAALEKVRNK